MLLASYPWSTQAACHQPDADPAWFTADPYTEDETKALAVCDRCPAAAECLETIMATEERAAAGNWPIFRYDVWGGTTPRARDALYLQAWNDDTAEAV